MSLLAESNHSLFGGSLIWFRCCAYELAISTTMTLARSQKQHDKPPAFLLPDLQLSPTGVLADSFFEDCSLTEGLFAYSH